MQRKAHGGVDAVRGTGVAPLKVGSLFTGIGGFDLGFERAGMEIAWQVEIDEFCNKVLAKHWPNVKRFKDVKTVSGKELEPVDLLCGGVPCQPASCAGKRRGTKDDRWLWKEPFRIIAELDPKPKWCVFENVRGLLTLENGLVFDNLLSELENLGYETRTFIIPACAVNAPHRRDRVWIVGNRTESGEPVATAGFKCGEYQQPDSHAGLFRSTVNEEQATRIKQQDSHAPDTNSGGLEGTVTERWDGINVIRQDSIITDTEKSKCESTINSWAGREGFTDNNFNVSNSEGKRLEGSIKADREQGQKSHDQLLHGCRGEWDENWHTVALRTCVRTLDDGLPAGLVRPKGWRVNSLKALGNAVVPQIPEILGRAIMGIDHET